MFIHDVLSEAFLSGSTEIKITEFQEYVRSLQSADRESEDGFKQQFEVDMQVHAVHTFACDSNWLCRCYMLLLLQCRDTTVNLEVTQLSMTRIDIKISYHVRYNFCLGLFIFVYMEYNVRSG